MYITYKTPELPEPGDSDLSKGISEVNKGNFKEAQTYFEKSATYGNEYGQLFCALIHFGGFDISERNPTKALEYFQAAETNWKNKIAQLFIGVMYLGGYGVVKDVQTGWKWIKKSINNNCIIAKVLLARTILYETKLYSRSFCLFKEVVESDLYNNSTLCLFENTNFKISFDGDNLDNPFQFNESTLSPNYLIGYKNITLTDTFNMWSFWYILTNNPFAVSMCQFSIGCAYYSGDIERDYSKSLKYLYKSAKRQNPVAYRCIGAHFEKGLGVKQDYIVAKKFFSKAKSLGDIESVFSLAICIIKSEGVSESYQMALSHFENYLSHDDVARRDAACFLMGFMLHLGKNGIKQDYKKALELYEKAWEYGCEIAAFQIGEVYSKGLGVKKNKKEAIDWYLKAASLNFYPAYYKLGCLELEGYKNKEDFDRGLAYLRKADEHGVTEALNPENQTAMRFLTNLRFFK